CPACVLFMVSTPSTGWCCVAVLLVRGLVLRGWLATAGHKVRSLPAPDEGKSVWCRGSDPRRFVGAGTRPGPAPPLCSCRVVLGVVLVVGPQMPGKTSSLSSEK